MKRKADKAFDVFISHTMADREAAASLAESFRAGGLEPFTGESVEQGDDVSEALWQALAESKALVAILSRPEPTPSMSVEIGAAQAWNKPIYAIASDPKLLHLPASLSHVRLLMPGAVEDIVRDIKSATSELTDREKAALRSVYLATAVPVDRFAMDHEQLRKITNRFNKLTGKNVSNERLLGELMRMRKRGALPALSRTAG